MSAIGVNEGVGVGVYTRRGSRCRLTRGQFEGINLVIGTKVDPTASNHPRIPLTRAAHLLVRPAACENDRVCVAIITVQALVVFNRSYPDNRVVGAVGRSDPTRASAAIVDVPSKSNRRRTCRINYITAQFAAPSAAAPLCKGTLLECRLLGFGAEWRARNRP